MGRPNKVFGFMYGMTARPYHWKTTVRMPCHCYGCMELLDVGDHAYKMGDKGWSQLRPRESTFWRYLCFACVDRFYEDFENYQILNVLDGSRRVYRV